MPMPEAPMHEKRESPPGKDQVWRAGQVFDMKPEPVSETVCGAPNDKLWLRALCTYAAHDFGTTGGRNYVCH